MEEKNVTNNTTVQFSFRDLFVNLKNKWIITLIVGLVALIVSFAGLFIVSKGKNTYVSNVHIEWPGIDNEQYPDGRTFNYKKIISKEYLELVKASDEEFKDIDIKDMYQNNGIQMSMKLEEKIKGHSEAGYNHYCTITVKQKYFNDKQQARDFVSKLIEEPTFNRAYNEVTNYKLLNYFNTQRETTEYPEMINNIGSQVRLQKQTLDKLINDSSLDFVYDEVNKQTLGNLAIEYQSFLKYNDYNRFEYEMKNNKYVRNIETYKDEFNIRKDTIELELEKNTQKIIALEALHSNQQGQDSVPQLIADLTLRNEDLKWEKKYIDDCLASATSNKKFENKIMDYQQTITDFNKKIELAYHEIYGPQVILEYDENKVIVSEGMGIVKIGLFAIVFTIIVEFILSLILTYSVNKKKQLD